MAKERVAEKEAVETLEAPEALSVPKFRQAVDWAAEKSMENGATCGCCGWRPWDVGTKEQTLKSLAAHIRRKHRDTIIELFDHQVLDLGELTPSPLGESEEEVLAMAGISEIRELDHFDYFSIPEAIKERMEQDGSVPRFVRQDRVEHFKLQGAKTVEGEGAHNNSTEDGVIKANELVLMELPHELAERTRSQKDARVQDQLNARGEEMAVARDKYEQRTYDYLRSNRNLDHQQATQVSRALAQRRVREGGDSNLGLTIESRQGSERY